MLIFLSNNVVASRHTLIVVEYLLDNAGAMVSDCPQDVPPLSWQTFPLSLLVYGMDLFKLDHENT